jgi:hypothetical protein
MRYSLAFFEWLTGSIALSHFIFAIGVSVLASETVQILYLLSLHHFKSPHMALLASLLAILPSSPATFLFVPYTEPFFTYLSYRGELVLEQFSFPLTHFQECWHVLAISGLRLPFYLLSQAPSDQMGFSSVVLLSGD